MAFESVRLTWSYPGSHQNHYKDHYSAPMAACCGAHPGIFGLLLAQAAQHSSLQGDFATLIGIRFLPRLILGGAQVNNLSPATSAGLWQSSLTYDLTGNSPPASDRCQLRRAACKESSRHRARPH